MKQLRSTGLFAIACGVICFIIAIERYASAVATAKEIARQIEGFEFESVAIPIETTVSGLAGIGLVVAGLRLVFESRRARQPNDGMLPQETGEP